jgi:hypothetical protein
MTERSKGHRWEPITDVMAEQRSLRFPELDGLIAVFGKRRGEMEGASALREFQARLVRSWSIETGILERLYTLSDSATLTLLEQGFDAALLSHGDSDLPPEQLVTILRDHQDAAEGLFEFVKGGRPLTTSYVKQLHQVFTRHQPTCDAVDGQGNWVQVPLRRGEWKLLPNNPGDVKTGEVWHQYSPPEQVASEMDRLIALHGGHADVHYVVEAAWLHHRFAQIHPFQDGNGRVARALASLVCIRGGGFPVVVMREQKAEYIRALEQADKGDLGSLVAMFERLQRGAFLKAMIIAEGVEAAPATVAALIDAAKQRLASQAEELSPRLVDHAAVLFSAAREFLEQTARDLKSALGDSVQTRLRSDAPTPNVIPIVGVSLIRGHGANVGDSVLAVELCIQTTAESRLVVAVLPMARASAGLMMAVAFLVLPSDPFHGRDQGSVDQLYDEPMTFTADRDPRELAASFRSWLEACVVRGLDRWRRGL